MARAFDAAVVGLGAMGAACLRALARRGLRVVGFDRFTPPHAFGSSHGRTRVIREAYFEHPSYVPLVQRAYLLWEEIEREAERTLGLRTGGLMIGPPAGAVIAGTLESARHHGLPCERIDAVEIRRRFPAFRPAEGMVGVWEPRTGVLFPEECVTAVLDSARRSGATVRTNENVASWVADGEGVRVRTDRGSYRAAWLVLAAGAWTTRLIPDLELPLTIERVVQFWLEPGGATEDLAPGRSPITIWEYEPNRYFYVFPLMGRLLKVAFHGQGRPVDPDRLGRDVGDEEVEPLRLLLRAYMPDADGPLRAAAPCMYTSTPDGHFVLDRHPLQPKVMVVSACSGHGFKFAPTIGEAVSDLVVEGATRFDLGLFGIGRWRSPSGGGIRAASG